MEHISIELLKTIVSHPVEIAILDKESEEQPSFFQKIVNKIELCPDKTHLRIYFDHHILSCYSCHFNCNEMQE